MLDLLPDAAVELVRSDLGWESDRLSTVELGVRLRYEIRKEFAPYIGVEWARKTGGTASYARYAHLAGDEPDVVNFVNGFRFWF